jgi:hypothetical protein
MKLLLLGSLLMLLGVVGLAWIEWAAFVDARTPHQEARRAPVAQLMTAGGRGGDTRPSVVIWQTSTAREDCAELLDRRRHEARQRIADLMKSGSSLSSPSESEEESSCALFQLGEVETGTQVEILDAYGELTKVRVLSGGLRGREGFVQRRLLEAPD